MEPVPVLKVLVCFALPDEARPFRNRIGDVQAVRVLVTGVGQRKSEAAFGAALAGEQFSLVLTCGYAGGLNPALSLGSVVFDCDAEFPLKQSLLATGGVEAKFHCSDRIAVTAADKARLRAMTGADAVEMESDIIRRRCRERGIPSATVRVISDTAQEDLPMDFNTLMNAEQQMDFTRLAVAVLRSPRTIPALLRLQRHTRFAAGKLGEVLANCIKARLT